MEEGIDLHDFKQTEEKILEYWQKNSIFRKLREKNKGKKRFSFIDGPITANNPMGVHHAWGRTYKDVFQRYKAMKGFDQRFQNGFDCQGLWVEVEVEKELGIKNKEEIEKYGIERFSKACKQRVLKYSDLQTKQSIRLGQWMDWENSYYTMSDKNIEYIWYFLKKCWENGWLYRGHRVMPWCVRCGTSLSQHELLDSYKETKHTALYLKLPVFKENFSQNTNEYILVWTTTPWTLPANVALAVHPEIEYAKVKQGEDILYLCKKAVKCLDGDYEIIDTLYGTALLEYKYRGPFDEVKAQKSIEHKIIPWKGVSEDEGTGVVHIAPGCGAEDFQLAKELGLDMISPIDENGYFIDGFENLSGLYVFDVKDKIISDLKHKKYLYKMEEYVHRYPFCWRCGTELVFRLVGEWFISVEEIRERLINANKSVSWMPKYAGKLMEDWLTNMQDWCISRRRFWGLPLPFYPCKNCGALTVIGSTKELFELADNKELLSSIPELHRPWIDRIKIRCPKCGMVVERTPEVGDCWLDAGIVPFSTLKYLEDREYWRKWYPADLVSEMRAQIRGWFYSLLFMGVTLAGKAPYRTVFTYEEVRDKYGREMHKSWGNAVWLDEAVEKVGADVLRWMYCLQKPETPLNFDFEKCKEIRKRMMFLLNISKFFNTYYKLDNCPKIPKEFHISELHLLDRWIISRIQTVIKNVVEYMDNYKLKDALEVLEKFIVEDFSEWYIRRVRRRFWRTDLTEDKLVGYKIIYDVLLAVCKLLAPIVPFITEAIYLRIRNLVGNETLPESVHLFDYPSPQPSWIDSKLERIVEEVRDVVSLGLKARNRSGIKVRQPLEKMWIYCKRYETSGEYDLMTFKNDIMDELNVKNVDYVWDISFFLRPEIKLKRSVLGPKYGSLIKDIEMEINNLSSEYIMNIFKTRNELNIEVHGKNIALTRDDMEISYNVKEGFFIEENEKYAIILKTSLTDELIKEGIIRDFVRNIQYLRKEMNLSINDSIIIYFNSDKDIFVDAIKEYQDYIKTETLATDVRRIETKIPDNIVQKEIYCQGINAYVGIKPIRELSAV